MSENIAYPSQTSNNTSGDTPTQGYNSSILAPLDPGLANNVDEDVIGLLSTGTDNFIGTSFVHPEHIPQLSDVLDQMAATDQVEKAEVDHILTSARQFATAAPFVKPLAANLVTTGGVFLPAPSGAASAVTSVRIAAYDPQRYRITLHPWVSGSGATGQVWIGKQQGDVAQSASGIPMGAFPLSTGNANAQNIQGFNWADDLYVSPDVSNTIDTWVFFVIERYA
jgi:hypothetical protein